jgi:methyl coenzyme M reductase system subunit A2
MKGLVELYRQQFRTTTAMMFQRTFALYGNDRVIENVLRALDDINYPEEKSINRAAFTAPRPTRIE